MKGDIMTDLIYKPTLHNRLRYIKNITNHWRYWRKELMHNHMHMDNFVVFSKAVRQVLQIYKVNLWGDLKRFLKESNSTNT